MITENLSSIRSHVTRGPVQSRYNYRLTSLDTRSLELRHIFEEQTTDLKLISVMVSSCVISKRDDTDFTIALATAVVDTSMNRA